MLFTYQRTKSKSLFRFRPKNFFLPFQRSLSNLFKNRKRKMNRNKKFCSNHSNVCAVVYCKECKKFFCEQCKAAHHSLFEGHKELPAGSVTDFDLLGGMCAVHTKYPLDSFCMDCNGINATTQAYFILLCFI